MTLPISYMYTKLQCDGRWGVPGYDIDDLQDLLVISEAING